jgi:hypothetical protein
LRLFEPISEDLDGFRMYFILAILICSAYAADYLRLVLKI